MDQINLREVLELENKISELEFKLDGEYGARTKRNKMVANCTHNICINLDEEKKFININGIKKIENCTCIFCRKKGIMKDESLVVDASEYARNLEYDVRLDWFRRMASYNIEENDNTSDQKLVKKIGQTLDIHVLKTPKL